MKKKIIIGVVVVIALFLISGLIYFIFMYESDEKILNNLDDQIKIVEKNLDEDETADAEFSTTIVEDISEDDSSMNELEDSLDSILNSLEEMESAETSLGTTVE